MLGAGVMPEALLLDLIALKLQLHPRACGLPLSAENFCGRRRVTL
jgi:hypothetical protein